MAGRHFVKCCGCGTKRCQSNQLADVGWRAIAEDRALEIGVEGLKLRTLSSFRLVNCDFVDRTFYSFSIGRLQSARICRWLRLPPNMSPPMATSTRASCADLESPEDE